VCVCVCVFMFVCVCLLVCSLCVSFARLAPTKPLPPGIFRHRPGATDFAEAKKRLETKPAADAVAAITDPHVAASLLKLLLRELPESLIPAELYAPLCACMFV